MADGIDPRVRKIAIDYIARVKTGRAVKALQAMLDNESVTTDDLSAMGYEHPPRAIGDIRDQGIPVVTERAVSSSDRRMARYRLGSADQVREGQTGRTNFSKKFRALMLATYGPVDAITRAVHKPSALQIDHRVPYRVAGDDGLVTDDVTAFMLLDAKSQRAKSWDCEHCINFIDVRDTHICRRCYWASPDDYDHVAMADIRRVDVVWSGNEVADHERLRTYAAETGQSLGEALKASGRNLVKPVDQ